MVSKKDVAALNPAPEPEPAPPAKPFMSEGERLDRIEQERAAAARKNEKE